jgi:WG containing repeat
MGALTCLIICMEQIKKYLFHAITMLFGNNLFEWINNIKLIKLILCFLSIYSGCTTNSMDPKLPLLYPVQIKNKWGYIDTSGNIVIKPRYLAATNFANDLALVTNEEGDFIINQMGQQMCKIPIHTMPISFNGVWFKIDNFSEDSIKFFNVMGQKMLSISRKGISNVSGNFDDCNRLVLVIKEDEYLFVNKSGNPIFRVFDGIPGSFDAETKLARILHEKKTCYIDTFGNNKFCINGKGDVFSSRLALIEDGYKKYYIDENGNKKIDVYHYDQVFPFIDGLSLVIKKGKQGFINTKGEIIIPLKYQEITNFTGGVAAVQFFTDNRWRLINLKNQVVSNNTFDWVDRGGFAGYLCRARSGNVEGWINRQGKFVWTSP